MSSYIQNYAGAAVLWIVVACGKSKEPERSPAPPPPAVMVASIDAAVIADAADNVATPCTAESVRAARKQAEAHVKAGAVAAAIELLERSCRYQAAPDSVTDEAAWATSDLAFAYYKAAASRTASRSRRRRGA